MADSESWRANLCKALIHERRLMGEALGFELVENANFDILIELYLARMERRQVFVWSLCAAANAPYSTAYRKITQLVAAGLILRHDDTNDRRRVEVELTSRGVTVLDNLIRKLAGTRGSPMRLPGGTN
ncbi:MarR family transcriptional regulator [Sphingomonas sp. 1185]|uniref:MarR family transcriptional regulator n=1 Tax=Sphingomonas sp. 1185 TaxID=3156411 RepID=UPI003398F41B